MPCAAARSWMGGVRESPGIAESQNHQGWKRPLRSPSPAINPAPPCRSPGLPGWDRVPRGAAGPEAPAPAAAHLGKPSHVVPNNLGVRALQFLDDLEALVELGEDVHHGAREERVLRRLLELGEREAVLAGGREGRYRPRWGHSGHQGTSPLPTPSCGSCAR